MGGGVGGGQLMKEQKFSRTAFSTAFFRYMHINVSESMHVVIVPERFSEASVKATTSADIHVIMKKGDVGR